MWSLGRQGACKLLTLALAFFILSLTSCTIDTLDNGDLDGAWHLLRINDKECKYGNIYWSIQGKLLEATDKSDLTYRFLLRFQHSGNTLQLSEPYIYDREDGDKPLDDLQLLEHVGIADVSKPFSIVTLNGSRMTLQTADDKLEFRKF